MTQTNKSQADKMREPQKFTKEQEIERLKKIQNQTNKSDMCKHHVISVGMPGTGFTQIDLEVICKKCGKTLIYNEKTNTYDLKIENKPPEWWIEKLDIDFPNLQDLDFCEGRECNCTYCKLKLFISQTLLTERAKTAKDLKEMFNRCKTEKGLSQALASYLKLLE